MVVYNFKSITVVPSGKDFVDIVLSKTQRKTPTVVHPSLPISRIRRFYMKKIKYAAQTYHDKMQQILEEFPILDDIHPFYADLMNVLYDKDHYKLALGQLNTAKHMVDNIAKDYLKLLKYGDSLYRCKQLKRAALGRMCTLMGRQGASLAYLEQVRQHLARLPSIDPGTRTLILCGYPNVGKSSFLNKVTRADVDVQPYPFTTKSLFVGHTDYQYLRWQVIDTPGILDHPLEERNTIEMQSITALAHLKAAILYLIDISEHCGYTIAQQVSLFNSLKPLFSNKPMLVVANKIDVCSIESLSPENKALLDSIITDGAQLIPMSNMSEEGIANVKQIACDRLLEQRVESKVKSKKGADMASRLHVAIPAPRDDKVRKPVIPESVLKKAQEMQIEKTEKQGKEEEEDTTPFYLRGYTRPTWKEQYDLANPEWKDDVIPEIYNGKNIADFIDPEIMARLDELEKEEEEREVALENAMEEEEEVSDIDEEDLEKVKRIRERRVVVKQENRVIRGRGTSSMSAKPKAIMLMKDRTADKFEEAMERVGVEPEAAVARLRSMSADHSRGRKRARSESVSAALEEVEQKKARTSSKSRSRSQSMGISDPKVADHVAKVSAKQQKSAQRADKHVARKGESDRKILDMKPKHLNSGKRKGGKTDRR